LEKGLLYNEPELLIQIAEGNQDAFERLYRHYRNKAYTIALTYLTVPDQAEDILQECFLKLWYNRRQLPEIENFDSYLFIMLRNELISALRKTETQQKIIRQVQQTAALQPAKLSGIEQAESARLQLVIREIIAKLPVKHQQIYQLSREEGLSHAAIAEQFGISPRTVSNLLSIILNQLRTALRSRGYLPETILAALIVFF
jgi:RNA polymerase sigma-70 factor (family 1)